MSFTEYVQAYMPSPKNHNSLNTRNQSSLQNSKFVKTSQTKLVYFWDLENCRWSTEKNGTDVVSALRQEFSTFGTEVQFTVVCDVVKEPNDLINSLNEAQVDIIHVASQSKNAADEKLKSVMNRFADCHGPPCVVVLISSDANFLPIIQHFRYRKDFYVVLLHRSKVSSGLLSMPNEHRDWQLFLDDNVPNKSDIIQNIQSTHKILVTNLPQPNSNDRETPNKIRQRLNQLSSNCGGQVENLNLNRREAVIRFSNLNFAQRGLQRLQNEKVYNNYIRCIPYDDQQDQGPNRKRTESPSPCRSNAYVKNQIIRAKSQTRLAVCDNLRVKAQRRAARSRSQSGANKLSIDNITTGSESDISSVAGASNSKPKNRRSRKQSNNSWEHTKDSPLKQSQQRLSNKHLSDDFNTSIPYSSYVECNKPPAITQFEQISNLEKSLQHLRHQVVSLIGRQPTLKFKTRALLPALAEMLGVDRIVYQQYGATSMRQLLRLIGDSVQTLEEADGQQIVILSYPTTQTLRRQQIVAIFCLNEMNPISIADFQMKFDIHFNVQITNIMALVEAMPDILRLVDDSNLVLVEPLNYLLLSRRHAIVNLARELFGAEEFTSSYNPTYNDVFLPESNNQFRINHEFLGMVARSFPNLGLIMPYSFYQLEKLEREAMPQECLSYDSSFTTYDSATSQDQPNDCNGIVNDISGLKIKQNTFSD